ncbi:MAG: oxygen-independent coproporphyrinogen III oxidase [Bacteriovorax sp.]|jgi:oxygen-independent coproporphyrinogen III oxidase
MKKMSELIQKYNRPGPRYTSYPPVPFWSNRPSESEWICNLKTNYKDDVGVDLYVHVPFCESLCYYCGCNRTITKNHEVESHYMASLLKEWNLYIEKLGFIPRVNSLHFGGGTPTFLSPQNLDQLMSVLLENKSDAFIGSIEIDPRTCRDEHIQVLANHGIVRVSLGIQDFDPDVQKAINRDQTPQMVEEHVVKLRKSGIISLNFDLIYGLPKQSSASILKTIEIVARLKPDLIAFYSYAHLPERIKNQRLIVENDLPAPSLKRELYELGKKLLIENGYVDIGMDHFSLPSNFLYRAMKEKKLHRNFMGFVDKKSSLLIGLGPSSISDSSISFVQNCKDVKNYQQKVMSNQLPIESGHTQNKCDLLIQKTILEMMCQGEFELSETDEMPYWNEISKELNAFADDGLIVREKNKIALTETGKIFVRNIAMIFDYHLREKSSSVKFSQTI